MSLAKTYVQKMTLYSPPLGGRTDFDGILLDFNERTIPVSDRVRQAMIDYVTEARFNVYPFYDDFTSQLAEYAGISKDQLMLTNGADQGIELLFRTFTGEGDKVIIPGPSFAMFYQCAQSMGNEILMPTYRVDDMSYPLEEIIELIDDKVRLIVVCNPNNPSGTLLEIEGIERLLKAAPGAIILVDEAYFEFAQVTAVSLLKEYSNLAITRTFSKAFGLCGLRLGYLMSQAENIQEMMKVRGPYDLNMAAYSAAKASLENLEDMKAYVKEVMIRAKPLVEVFFDECRVPYYKSQSNYILFRPWDKEVVFNALKNNGILTRPQSGINVKDCIRVSIGTADQMRSFIEVYRKYCLPPKT